ncbi:hypothetical protein BOTBODRAFT_31509 [Botryobasidium botryosum FD-172 SS1]|uniref:Uncharacterized protein n=1 Tax=Botryobasidium botryosum (strain FD-172 SS1) TaxID=930990 RepID=A0A067MJ84_BOTB1|nr:hypothetical protein BOTBODRAFT_31509 [Botryobasidium botryosum FD-172 SS1]
MFHRRAAVLWHIKPSRTISSDIPPPKLHGIPLAKDLGGIYINSPEELKEIKERGRARRAAFLSKLDDTVLELSGSEPRKPSGSLGQKLLKRRGLPEPDAPTGAPIQRTTEYRSIGFDSPRRPRTPHTPQVPRETTGEPWRKFDRRNERPVATNKPPYKKREVIRASSAKEARVDESVAEEGPVEPNIHAPTAASVPPTLSHDALISVLGDIKRQHYSHTAPLSNRVYTALPVPIPAAELFSKTSKYYVGEKRAPLMDKKEKRIQRHAERQGGDYSRHITAETATLAARQPFLRVTERAQLVLSTNRSIPVDKRQLFAQVIKDAVEPRA